MPHDKSPSRENVLHVSEREFTRLQQEADKARTAMDHLMAETTGTEKTEKKESSHE